VIFFIMANLVHYMKTTRQKAAIQNSCSW